jgi:hypothetical protein
VYGSDHHGHGTQRGICIQAQIFLHQSNEIYSTNSCMLLIKGLLLPPRHSKHAEVILPSTGLHARDFGMRSRPRKARFPQHGYVVSFLACCVHLKYYHRTTRFPAASNRKTWLGVQQKYSRATPSFLQKIRTFRNVRRVQTLVPNLAKNLTHIVPQLISVLTLQDLRNSSNEFEQVATQNIQVVSSNMCVKCIYYYFTPIVVHLSLALMR